jgi:hypothetical protein
LKSEKLKWTNKFFHQKSEIEQYESFSNDLALENKEALSLLLRILKSKSKWNFVGEKQGVKVEKMFLPAGTFVSDVDAAKGSKHACIKSSGIIDASAEDVFNLFLDNSRVKEYNEHCVEVKDVKYFPKQNNKQWFFTLFFLIVFFILFL